MQQSKLQFFLALALLLTVSLSADEAEIKALEKEDRFPVLSLRDQNDKPASIQTGTLFVIFVSDIDASKIVHSILEKDGDSWLQQRKAAFISDIHRMPGIITRLFALPKMRDYHYTMRLIRDDEKGRYFPNRKGMVTVLTLDAKRVVRDIQMVDSVGEIEAIVHQ